MRHQSTKIAVTVGLIAAIVMTALTVFVDISITRFQRDAEGKNRERLLADYDRQIKMLVENVVSSVAAVHERQENGELSDAEARDLAKMIIRESVYGESGYFWADRSDGILVAHHYLRDNEGADRSDLEDANGNKIIQNILKAGPGGGYTEYWFPKEEGGESYPKRAYSLLFEPYDWIISTGNYYDDIDATIQAMKTEHYQELNRIIILLSTFSVVAIAAFVLIIFVLVRQLTKPLRKVESALDEIAEGAGNLTQRIELSGKDEVGRVAHSFDRFVGTLQEMIGGIQESVGTLQNLGVDLSSHMNETAAAVNQISANIGSVLQQVHSQEEQVSTTASSVEELTRNVDSLKQQINQEQSTLEETAGHIDRMLQNIQTMISDVQTTQSEMTDLKKRIQDGQEGVEGASKAVEQIMDRSVQLQEANSFIVGIAAQTNLLAMNAAIEAAHAGESGRGFAVVAEEIRKLADQSSKQSGYIAQEINGIHEEIKNTSEQTASTKQLFELVSSTIEKVNEVFAKVSDGAQQQAAAGDQVGTALKELRDIADSVQNGASEMSNANEQILQAISDLRDRSVQMRSSMDEISSGTNEINTSVTSLNDLSDQNREAIEDITSRVKRFET